MAQMAKCFTDYPRLALAFDYVSNNVISVNKVIQHDMKNTKV